MQFLEVHLAVNSPLETALDSAADRLKALFPRNFSRGTTHRPARILRRRGKRNSNRLTAPRASNWSVSRAKRWFDVAAVVASLPLAIPVLLLVAVAVRLSSAGPILFVQTRVGRYGKPFRIFKFRTMIHESERSRPLVTTRGSQCFTPVGRFLRKWKLDELPQLLNVLRADMSLVGPRPKVPDHEARILLWRPGITGAATLVFAEEEILFEGVPEEALEVYVQRVILPAKRQIDAEYMYRATFSSDIAILVRTLLRRWNSSTGTPHQPLIERGQSNVDAATAPREELSGVLAGSAAAED